MLRLEMARWTEWLANEHPPWAAYRAVMACRLVALDKQPGTRPVGIGEIYRRFMAKCVLMVVGHQATVACGNLNLCAGLPAGIEGAVHAVQEFWEGAQEPLDPAPYATQEAWCQPVSQPEEARAQEEWERQVAMLHTQPGSVGPMGTPEGSDGEDSSSDGQPIQAVLLVDARNGFNELGRKAMLWTVRHLWPAGARFSFNCYRHSAQLVVRREGQPCHMVQSREGVTQGASLSMVLYGLSLTPLAKRLRTACPDVLQPWYADDMAMAGAVDDIAEAMGLLQQWGPARGYFPEPEKSVMVCRDEQQGRARGQLLAHGLHFRYSSGQRYIGGFVGTVEARQEWVEEQAGKWADGVRILGKVATRFPQTAYAGLAKSLQHEWQYLQRVTPEVGPQFAEVERALTEGFLPALLKESAEGVAAIREQLALPVRWAGLGVPDPTKTSTACYQASVGCTEDLSRSLLDRQDLDASGYAGRVRAERRGFKEARAIKHEAAFDRLSKAADVRTRRRMQRSKEGGQWLTVQPTLLNGTQLSMEEFTDSVRLRFGLLPHSLPAKCDGCQQTFSVEHAMKCKKGGLIVLRHNDISATWKSLSLGAFPPSAVADEPLILKGRANDGNCTGGEVQAEIRGDVAVHGFWQRGSSAIFDIRVTDTDCPTYRSMDPSKVLARHEKEKKDKYLDACLERRKSFTPLVFSVDGMAGKEAIAACKRLASLLANKWKREYSGVCGYVRSRLSIALVRTTSMCLRGARDPTAYRPTATFESGAGLRLYR